MATLAAGFYVYDLFGKAGRRIVSGPFASRAEAEADRREYNTAGDLVVIDHAGVVQPSPRFVAHVEQADGRQAERSIHATGFRAAYQQARATLHDGETLRGVTETDDRAGVDAPAEA